MKQLPLWIPFCLALFAFFFRSVFLPSIHLFAFAPFLALFIQKKNLYHSLWAAILIGLLTDLYCTQMRFGMFALCTGITTLLCYRWKSWFNPDRLISTSLYTGLISMVSTLIQCVLMAPHIHFSALFLPFLDGVYAFFWFSCPLLFLQWLYNRRFS